VNTINQEFKAIQPLLKWAGNKKRIMHRILPLLPAGDRLIEPFCGSAAVFVNTHYKKNIVADTNSDVINLYLHLQKDAKTFIKFCHQFFVSENNIAENYYELRKQFNETEDKQLRAALFLYINKHCFNGLCRYNKKGGFNVPFGRYKKIYLPEERMIFFAEKAKHAKFIISDFSKTMEMAKTGDVIYCDPPYVPVNDSNSSFKYEKEGFSMDQQAQLAALAEKTANRGIPVLISNHYTDFTREIYKNAELTTLSVKRHISCNAEKRVEASEVLALFK